MKFPVMDLVIEVLDMKFAVMNLAIEVLDMKFSVMKLTRCFPRERYWHKRGNTEGKLGLV